ncbi:ACT domain-containing protein [Bacteroidales bacterium OttesenSCG-928-C19]|nr:ACT domain-containing protein [Bacteroidales bacterium OttesenSCG-928-C19]
MAYNEYNYLIEVKHTQALVQEKLNIYAFITYKRIWIMLREERRYFKSYATFLKHIGECNIDTRIATIRDSNSKNS